MSRFSSLEAWLDWQSSSHPKAIDLGLDRLRSVAQRLALDVTEAQIVSVAGTNGKGSTCAFMETIALSAGCRVGVYSSPHLLRYNERIRLQGEDVDDALLLDAFAAIDAARGDVSLSYFEWGSLAAMWIFQHQGMDLWLMEVGLGGRLDAVNLLDADVAVLTSVGLDHQEWLGHDRLSIAREKLGIARPGRPLIIGETDPPEGFWAAVDNTQAEVVALNRDLRLVLGEAQWCLQSTERTLCCDYPALGRGVYVNNAALAVLAMSAVLGSCMFRKDLDASMRDTRVPARQQWEQAQGIDYCLDVAHNPDSARALAQNLSSRPAAGRTVAVFTAMQDKDITAMLAEMFPVIDEWHLFELPMERAVSLARLAELCPQGQRHEGPVAAWWEPLHETLNRGDRVVLFGSFYAVAELLPWVNARIMHASTQSEE